MPEIKEEPIIKDPPPEEAISLTEEAPTLIAAGIAEERLKKDPQLASTIGDKIGNDYARQMDVHARDSQFLKDIFSAVDVMDVAGLSKAQADERKQDLKDEFYQTFLQNQPDRSIRNQFIHRNSVEGFSQDALRNFSQASFNIAYQQARFE